MQIPRTIDRLDEAGFCIWLRRYGAIVHRTIKNSACVVKFEVRSRKGKVSYGSIWTYDGLLEYQGAAMLNYALFMMRGRPTIDPNNCVVTETVEIPTFNYGKSGSALRKKRSFRQKILLRDGTKCFYCDHEMENGDITLEHLIPRSQGGKTTPENIVLAHAYCNNRAGTLCLDEKLALRGKIRPPHIAWQEKRYGT